MMVMVVVVIVDDDDGGDGAVFHLGTHPRCQSLPLVMLVMVVMMMVMVVMMMMPKSQQFYLYIFSSLQADAWTGIQSNSLGFEEG